MLRLFDPPPSPPRCVPRRVFVCVLAPAQVHARRPQELRLDRLVAWLSSGLGLQDKAILRQEGVWDAPLHETPEFQQALEGSAANRGS